MTNLLFTADHQPQRVGGEWDEVAAATLGPAALLAAPVSEIRDSSRAADAETPLTHSVSVTGSNRPLAYREAGAEWHEIGFEAADHWTQMTPELRRRLIDDHMAKLDVAEFKVATKGGSASIITNNWVYSGSPRVYRVAGELREFVTVLGLLNCD